MKLWATVFCAAVALSISTFFLFGKSQAPKELKPEVENRSEAVHYEIVPGRSKFMVHAFRGGLAGFKGHDHFIAVKDFSGQAQLTLDALNPASLNMSIRAASLEETSDVFTAQQKGIIKKELDDLVLESAKYPEITFRSSDVKGVLKNGQFDVKIGGDITLHGVTK